MAIFKGIKSILICLLFLNTLLAQTNDTTQLLKSAKIKETYYEPSSRGGYLGLSIGIMLTTSVVVAGLLYAMPESVTNWDKNEIKNIFKNYKRKVSKGPVVDKDDMWINYIGHPYFGAIYYLQPRMAGFAWSESVFFSFIASSLFWEYGVEGFAEIPSWQDLVITPAIGSLVGEGFYRIIRYIQSNDNKLFGQWWLGKTIIWILDPIGSLIYSTGLGELFGIYNKNANTLVTTPILPNGRGGVKIGFALKF